jgi:hypothetical protein
MFVHNNLTFKYKVYYTIEDDPDVLQYSHMGEFFTNVYAKAMKKYIQYTNTNFGAECVYVEYHDEDDKPQIVIFWERKNG